ncbi:MAG: MBL fold metallo-hydrolase [Desulfovibrionaceae bacterium]
MRVRFWGVRGSTPVPGKGTVRYGGNTSCIEIRSRSGDLVILDGGTGIRPLGLELAKSDPLTCAIFITHPHWDHIHGLPFFAPLFIPGNTVDIYCPPDPIHMRGAEYILENQMIYPHFPIRRAELRADVRLLTLSEGQYVEVGDLTIGNVLMNHPSMNLGYRVEGDGASLFFTGDHEPFTNVYEPEDSEHAEYQRLVDRRTASVDEFVSGVDLLIADGQYSEEEYATRVGWGHSSFGHALDFARRVGSPELVLTHHDAIRNDAELDAIDAQLKKRPEAVGLHVRLAYEGLEMMLGET